MYRLAVILLALATAASCPALAAEVDTLSSIGAQLDHYAVLRSDFKQSKQMSALKRPLATSGHLVFSREHGILWQIEQPYRMTYVLGDDRIVEISADGTRRERGLRDLPGLTQMSKIFRAVFSANTAALRDVFEIGVQAIRQNGKSNSNPAKRKSHSSWMVSSYRAVASLRKSASARSAEIQR